MDPIEKLVVGASTALLSLFAAVIIFSYFQFGFNVPTCVSDMEPFHEGSISTTYDPITHKERYDVKLVSKMWAFDPPEIVVTQGSEIDLYLSSPDVIHGFSIARTNANLMAVPGAVNYIRLRFDEPGDYPFLCHEYCGVGHQAMAGKIRVLSASQKFGPDASKVKVAQAALSDEALAGKGLVEKNGCLACHSLDGSALLAPTFKGSYGLKRELASGKTVTVDDAYVKESIIEPGKELVKGFQPLMPQIPLTDDEVNSILAYLRSL
jgi:cytochrome c oxidase subunit 2